MKLADLANEILPVKFHKSKSFLGSQWQKRPLPLQLFLLLCLNLATAPVVQAASAGELSRGNAYALGLLGLVTVGLSVYLFVVIFQPERF